MEAAEERTRARVIRVRYSKGRTDLVYATSPDLQGLLVAERTAEALERAIPLAIVDIYAACGQQMLVAPLEKTSDADDAWVAVPTAVAVRALKDLASKSKPERSD